MKFLITPNLKGAYMTPAGVAVDIVPTEHGKDYIDQAEFTAALKLLSKEAFITKQTAIAGIQRKFEATLAKGFADNELGITIAIADADRQQFNDLEQHLARKAIGDDQPIMIKLLDGTLHQLNRGQFHQLLIRAGDYYLALWSDLQQKKNAL